MPVAAIMATIGPAVAKFAGSKAATKGAGFAVKAVSNIKTKAAEILTRKKDKAQQKAEEAKVRAAQIAALAGGTTYSSVQPQSMAEKLAFGASVKKVKEQEYKSNNQSMEKVTEFVKKNWLYVLGGVVVLMFLKKKR